MDSLVKHFLPLLIKLIADTNFKIASISLKIFEGFLKIPALPL